MPALPGLLLALVLHLVELPPLLVELVDGVGLLLVGALHVADLLRLAVDLRGLVLHLAGALRLVARRVGAGGGLRGGRLAGRLAAPGQRQQQREERQDQPRQRTAHTAPLHGKSPSLQSFVARSLARRAAPGRLRALPSPDTSPTRRRRVSRSGKPF